VARASQAAEKSEKPSFRGAFFAEESLLSWVSIEEGFLTESIPILIGIRNDGKMDFSRSLFSLWGLDSAWAGIKPRRLKPAPLDNAEGANGFHGYFYLCPETQKPVRRSGRAFGLDRES